MHLLVVDLETTGLNGNEDQILEVGIIAVDMGSTDRTRHKFRRLVMHERYAGNAVALAMNAEILKEIAEAEKRRKSLKLGTYPPGSREEFLYQTQEIVTLEELALVILEWVQELPFYAKAEKFTLTGKNVGSFDLSFLRMIPNWDIYHPRMKTAHRVMDPGPVFGSLFFDPQPPDLRECMRRAAVLGEVTHRALDDAADVLNTIERRSAIYRHKKTGNLYEVIEKGIVNATNDVNGQRVVLYRNGEGQTFVRFEVEFFEKFEQMS